MVSINFLSTFSFKIKIAIVLSILAFIASLIASFFSGAAFSVIIIRIVVSIIVFAVMGYAVGYVIAKYVPEIIVLFQNSSGSALDSGGDGGSGESNGGEANMGAEAEGDSSFSEMNTDELPRVPSSSGGSDGDNPFNLSEGRLGKHLLNTDDTTKYEPKLMAQAVRTMMTKDE